MLVRCKMKELMDGDVKFISLVDRAATRMPFRVVKRGTEMIDLTSIASVFKREALTKKDPVKPTVSAIIVYAQKNEDVAARVRKAITDNGYSVETVTKNADGQTIMFAQDKEPLKDAQLVRLSDTMVVAVKGFQPQNPNLDGTGFEDSAASKNFHQGVDSALDVLFDKICTSLGAAKSEQDAATTVGGLLDGFKKYVVGMVSNLPTAAFKVDLAVKAATEPKTPAEKGDILSLDDIEALLSKQCPTSMGENDWGNMSTHDKLTWLLDSTNTKKVETPLLVKTEPGAVVPPAVAPPVPVPPVPVPVVAGAPGTGNPTEAELAKAKEEADKRDKKLLDAITAMSAKVDGITTTMATVVEKQKELDTTLAGVVQKSDDLSKKLAGTVAAGAGPEDLPRNGKVTTIKEDPRTGCFDTAYLKRGEKIAARR
jgi:hypothetical protein